MEPEGSLPQLQVPATCPYPEPARSSPYPTSPSHFLTIHHQSISPGPRLTIGLFCNMIRFYGEDLLAPRPIPKRENHPLSAVRDCLFNIFTATLHIGGRSSIRNLRTRHAAMTGTHLSRNIRFILLKNQLYQHFILDYRRIWVTCHYLTFYLWNTFHCDMNYSRPTAVCTEL
jgi:hypothetical protein